MMAFNSGVRMPVITCGLLTLLIFYTTPVLAQDQEEGFTKPPGNHTPILCYQCNSWSDEGCSNLKANGSTEHYLKACEDDFYEGEPPFCRKTVQAIKGHTARVIRSCGWMRHPEDCYHTDDDHHIENVCQCYTDACNEAPRRRDATFLIAAALVSCMALL